MSVKLNMSKLEDLINIELFKSWKDDYEKKSGTYKARFDCNSTFKIIRVNAKRVEK